MKFPSTIPMRPLVLFVAMILAAHSRGAIDPALTDLTDEQFKTLAEKTNLYVKALNAASNVQRSYDRYASWVNVKKGPTGKENYISYGLYEISDSSVKDMATAATKGPALLPALPDVDAAVLKMAGAAKTLAPLVKQAEDYYEQEDYKDDGAKKGRELHEQMMPLFTEVFAAEKVLRSGLDAVKAEVDRRQLAQIEKEHGKNYEWHLRNYLIAAKALMDLAPSDANAPMIQPAPYQKRFGVLETAYNGFTQFGTEHPDEVKKVLLASFVESTVKDFYAATKFLRRVVEAPKPNRSDYVDKVNALIEKYNDLIQRTNSLH